MLSIYLSACLSIHLSMHPSIHSSVHLSIHPFIHPSIHPCIHLSIYPSIHLSIYPFILFHLQTAPKIFGGNVKSHLLCFFPSSSEHKDEFLTNLRTVAKDFKGKASTQLSVYFIYLYHYKLYIYNYPLLHLSIQPFIHPSIHLFIHPFIIYIHSSFIYHIHPLIYPFVHSSIIPFVHSFIIYSISQQILVVHIDSAADESERILEFFNIGDDDVCYIKPSTHVHYNTHTPHY